MKGWGWETWGLEVGFVEGLHTTELCLHGSGARLRVTGASPAVDVGEQTAGQAL